MYILGISCFYHDSAACLLKDGVIVAACQEERFSGIKHDWRFPLASIRYCLQEAGVSAENIDFVCFYEKPLLKFERVLETFLSTAPKSLISFLDVMPSWIKEKLRVGNTVSKAVGYHGKLLYAAHHEAHGASAFFSSPFDEAAILTVDGVGEWATASYGSGGGNRISLTHEMVFPDSLGLLYSAVTSFLGFAVNNDEYKVMGMAPYGAPEYYDLFTNKLASLRPDGSLSLNLEYFTFQYGRRMFNARKFEKLFGVSPRIPGGEITQAHFNIAASLQRITEDVILHMARHIQAETKSRSLCMSGGVALNSVANGRLLREGPFDDIFIQPAAGDAGGAVGAAYLAYHHHAGRTDRHALRDVYLGPSFSAEEIRKAVVESGLPFEELAVDLLLRNAAELLANGMVIGWFHGRMEFGPRALGNRSILADPRRPEMKDVINRKIKFRELFRPFAPVVLRDEAPRYFKLDRPSPYMLFTVPVLSDQIPAVTHVDGSARVQTVAGEDNPLLYDLLKAFKNLTGIPVLLNTSLNVKGRPIAMTPSDALQCLRESDMDAVVLDRFICHKHRPFSL